MLLADHLLVKQPRSSSRLHDGLAQQSSLAQQEFLSFPPSFGCLDLMGLWMRHFDKSCTYLSRRGLRFSLLQTCRQTNLPMTKMTQLSQVTAETTSPGAALVAVI